MKRAASSSDRRELIDLLVQFEGLSRSGAKLAVNESTPDSIASSLTVLRRKKIEALGQQSIDLGLSPPVASPEPRSKSKKVPYTLLLPPEQLAALRALSEADDSSVSHHIRQAIRVYLRKR